MSTYFEKYNSGNEKEVWDEIEALDIADLSPEQLEDINSVCSETMKRVLSNIEKLVSALKNSGFDFSKYPDGENHNFIHGLESPDSEVDNKIEKLETIAGPLPLSLKYFWKEVGAVSLVGLRDGWEDYSDPLFVASINDNLEVVEEWAEFRKECDDHAEDPFMLFISPDEDQKDGFEGGQFYNIELPCSRVDGLVKDAPSESTFIDYLREAFEAKGFPGLEKVPDFLKSLEFQSI